eukprot:707249-Prymnesium_polylepis.3
MFNVVIRFRIGELLLQCDHALPIPSMALITTSSTMGSTSFSQSRSGVHDHHSEMGGLPSCASM